MEQASGYYADRINEDGDFDFQIAKASWLIDYRKYRIQVDFHSIISLKTQLRSLCSNSDKHFICVMLDQSKLEVEAIIGHTCRHKVSRHGCYSHVAKTLRFFGFVRDQLSKNIG